MNIKKQIVSLELAKELKGEGYPQWDSLWYWLKNCLDEWLIVDENTMKYDRSQCSLKGDDGRNLHYLKTHPVYAAPTVAELGEKLNKQNEADARAKIWLLEKKGLTK